MSEAAKSWLDACRTFALQAGVALEILEVLSAFRSADPRGGPPPPAEPLFAGTFEALELQLLGQDPVLDDPRRPAPMPSRGDPFEQSAIALGEDVDPGQARMFARRLRSVDRALGQGTDPSARLLRVGLRLRLLGILRAPGPRALRLRALADFYYSQLGRHMHRTRGPGGPSMAELVTALSWSPVSAGLEHGRICGPCEDGPVYINLLRVDPSRVRVDAYDCRDALRRGVDFAAHTRERGAVAAVSGGFFLYSEPDIELPNARYDPVGLLLSEGRLLSPPVFRRGSVLVSDEGRIEIARLGLEALTIGIGGRALPGAAAITRAQARRGPAAPSVAITGDRVIACGEALPVPLNGFVLPTPPDLRPPVGALVDYAPLRSPSGMSLRSGVAGGPMLLDAGVPVLDMRGEDFWGSAPPVTFSQDETGDRNLLPRLGAGLDDAGRLVLAAIDGRNFERALGMTLAEVGRMMALLGCRVATNLDGGSSKRMVLHGQILDLTSTEIRSAEAATETGRVRPVHTGLLLFDRRA